MHQCIQNAGIKILPGGRSVDLDYAGGIIVVFYHHDEAQSTLDKLTAVVLTFDKLSLPTIDASKVLQESVGVSE